MIIAIHGIPKLSIFLRMPSIMFLPTIIRLPHRPLIQVYNLSFNIGLLSLTFIIVNNILSYEKL